MTTRLGFAVAAVLALLTALAVAEVPVRTLTAEDVIEQELISEATFSPDHSMLAYLRWKPTVTTSLMGPYRASVWIRPVRPGAQSIDVSSDCPKCSYSNLLWSPNGSKLAMLSFDYTTDSWHVAIWDRTTNQLTELNDVRVLQPALAWFDNVGLLVVLSEHGGERIGAVSRYAGRAYEDALNAKRGIRSTATVFESGATFTPNVFPQEKLVLVRADGTMQTIANGLQISDVSISPGNRYFAFLRRVGNRPLDNSTAYNPDYHSLGPYGAAFGLAIVNASGKAVPFHTGSAEFVRPGTFRWSPDGSSFAVQATAIGDPLNSRVFQGHVGGGLSEIQLGEGVRTVSFTWSAPNVLIVGGRSRGDRGSSRFDWWRVSAEGAPSVISSSMSAVPSTLIATEHGRGLLGVAGGDVWKYDVDGWKWLNLTGGVAPKITSLVNVDSSSTIMAATTRLIIRNDETSEYYRLDVESGSVEPLSKPTGLAQVVTYDSDTDSAVFLAAEDSGTFLTLDRHGSKEQIVAINQKLGQIVPGVVRSITYVSLDGQRLKAWVLLPAGYQEGKRYPLVTWVYAGTVFGSQPASTKINQNSRIAGTVNTQLFASKGYAVLVPSMPLSEPGQARDVYLELTKGVLPAVDEVVRMGIADPNRVAVAGMSFGGFSTYGLITQTNRFKAAIAIAGISDLVSDWGTFYLSDRYVGTGIRPEIPHGQMAYDEGGPVSMTNPPWKDAARYIRNSPLFFADRVQTPVLIIHGDLDVNVSIQQSEEFFSAMYRQGKRARYVQYSGEIHAVFSPANIRDMWAQFYAWLDEFCDVSRDDKGNLIFDGDHVRSRNGAPPLKPEDFAKFDELELKSHPWGRTNDQARSGSQRDSVGESSTSMLREQ